MKHLLKMADLSKEEIESILDLADQLKYEKKNHIPHPLLAGKTLGMIFQKSSTRTRVSFEVGMYQLGGHALFLSSNDLQIGRGEPVQDTARVLSRYLDGIMIRTFAQKEVEDLAAYGSIPVINGLTDYAHPCQVLADLLTIREKYAALEGAEALLHRGWKQHGQLPDCGLPHHGDEGGGGHAQGLPAGSGGAGGGEGQPQFPADGQPHGGGEGCGCGVHGHLGVHGPGEGEGGENEGLRRLPGQ